MSREKLLIGLLSIARHVSCHGLSNSFSDGQLLFAF